MEGVKVKMILSAQHAELLGTLQVRFEQYMNRHTDLVWASVKTRLEAHPLKLWSLHEMERTGGEPDVVGQDNEPNGYEIELAEVWGGGLD